MDLEVARFLTSSAGQAALGAAQAARRLPAHQRARALAGCGTPEQIRAALAQDDLRSRARKRIPAADRLLFESEALEQATAWRVAEERATRWPRPLTDPLVDLGAGIGIDALATAATGRHVVAIEHDPVRATLLTFNARTLGVDVDVRLADAAERAAEGGPLAFLDPARRVDGRRVRDPDAFTPPRDVWGTWLAGFDAAQVKLPPTAARDPDLRSERLEVVSLGGRARECRVFVGSGWGPLPRRRALALPAGTAIDGDGAPWPDPVAVGPGAWLLDPDPAVTLAGLVGDLARRHGLAPLNPRIAYLTGPRREAAPGRWLRVEAVLRARPREMNAWLAANDIGQLTVKTRGVDEDAAGWGRRLRPKGHSAGTIIVTRDIRDRWVAFGVLDGDSAR